MSVSVTPPEGWQDRQGTLSSGMVKTSEIDPSNRRFTPVPDNRPSSVLLGGGALAAALGVGVFTGMKTNWRIGLAAGGFVGILGGLAAAAVALNDPNATRLHDFRIEYDDDFGRPVEAVAQKYISGSKNLPGLDLNNNHAIDIGTLETGYQTTYAAAPGEDYRTYWIEGEDFFRKADTSGDNKVSVDELAEALDTATYGWRDDDVKNDGLITGMQRYYFEEGKAVGFVASDPLASRPNRVDPIVWPVELPPA